MEAFPYIRAFFTASDDSQELVPWTIWSAAILHFSYCPLLLATDGVVLYFALEVLKFLPDHVNQGMVSAHYVHIYVGTKWQIRVSVHNQLLPTVPVIAMSSSR